MRSAYYTKDPNQIVFSSLKEKKLLRYNLSTLY